MRKKWKEKMKSLILNKKFIKENGLFIGIYSPIIFLSWLLILQGSFWGTLLLTIPSIIMICFILGVGASENEKQKNEESKRNDNKQKEKKYLQILREKVEYSYREVHLSMRESVQLIERIQTECVLTKEEKGYLTITFPKQLLHMLDIFEKLDYPYQIEVEEEILAFLREKRKECTKTYIEPQQHQLVSACKQALQEAKEQKHEYIHVTIEE